jgi:hypothetical protein
MKPARLFPILIVAGIFFGLQYGDSCGPFLPEAQFTALHGPIADRPDFARGHLGVLRPHFYRRPLLVAYCYLSGVPLTPPEQAAIFGSAAAPQGPDPAPSPRPAVDAWLAARKDAGAPKLENLDTEKDVPGSQFQSYTNCLPSALETAAATLRERKAKWGDGNPLLAEWIHGQDQVFENCSAGPAIPSALPAGTDPLLAADRQYQIAAAEFYAQQFANAQRDFTAIASNAGSPWRGIAPYLAVRAVIREGTLQNQPEKLREAAKKLQQIVNDPSRKQWQASSQGLLDFIHAKLEPEARLVELGNQLMKPASPSAIARTITDYTSIWDSLEAKGNAKFPVDRSEVTDWIATFQNGEDGAHAVDRWRSTHTERWLAAALVWVPSDNSAVPDLIAAARQVKPDAPGYPTIVYNAIRLQLERGDIDAARQWAEQALGTKPIDTVQNLLRAERLKAARDWKDFLTFAPRKPVAINYGDADDYDAALTPDGDIKNGNYEVAFEADAERPLNRIVPLQLWMDASRNPLLPPRLQANIAQAGWVRSVLLQNDASARTLAERVRDLTPELADGMRSYLSQSDPAAAKFTAVFQMLRAPGIAPEIRAGLGRTTKVTDRDEFRDNWWSLSAPAEAAQVDHDAGNHEPLFDLYPNGEMGPTDFLPQPQKASGEKEWADLVKAGANSVNYLCSEAIAWTSSHPQDPRDPEALHLCVQATHYGPADKASSAYSKQAFELLHRKYPNSDWAKKTKYWY